MADNTLLGKIMLLNLELAEANKTLHVSTYVDDDGLEMTLDLLKGLADLEAITIKPDKGEENYEIRYDGQFSAARDSFLREENKKYVNTSEILKKFREEVERIKNEGKFEQASKNQIYQRRVYLTEKISNYDEVSNAARSILEIFKQKESRV